MDFAAMLASERRKQQQQQQQQQQRGGTATTPTPSIIPQYVPHRGVDRARVLVDGHPASYASAALSAEGRSRLLRDVETQPGWTRFAKRALLNLGGVPHPSGMIAEPLPDFMRELAAQLGLDRANQALVNDYRPDGSISRHKDGPNYESWAAILSVTGSCVLRFSRTKRVGDLAASVFLEPGSLFEFSGPLYEDYFHWIEPGVKSETGNAWEEVVPADCANAVAIAASAFARDRRVSVTLRRACVAVDADQVLMPDLEDERRRRRAYWATAVGDENE